MALSVGDLAVHMRLVTDPNAVLPAAQQLVLQGLLDAAACTVAERVSDAAPVALTDAATVAVAGYLHDRPSASQGDRHANAFRNSGAEAMLARHIPKRILTVGDEGDLDQIAAAFTKGRTVYIDEVLSTVAPRSRTVLVPEEQDVFASVYFYRDAVIDLDADNAPYLQFPLEDSPTKRFNRIEIFAVDTAVAYQFVRVGGGRARVILA